MRPHRRKLRQLSPLGEQRALIRRSEAPIPEVLTQLLGLELAQQFLHWATHVALEDVRSDERRTSEKGVVYAPRRSAIATLSPAPVRSVESAAVRSMALLLLHVLETFEPGGARTNSRGLYLGTPNAERPNGLSGRLGRSVRELERYLVVFRCAGVLGAHQPPGSAPGVVRSRRGYAYNVYTLQQAMPRELHEALQGWRASFRAKQVQAQRDAALAAPATPRGPLSESARAFAAKLLPPPEPPS